MFDDFEAHLRKMDRAAGTIRGYLADLGQFREWFERDTGETLNVATVTAMDLVAWRQKLRADRLGAATINRKLTAVRQWLKWGGNHEADNVRQVQTGPRLAPKGLARRQVAALLRAARRGRHPRRDLALVGLLVETGLRIGEVAGLKLGDLTINGRSGSVRVVHGKGLKERVVPLNAGARRVLREWLEVRPASFGEYVFTSQKGGALSKNAMQRVVAVLAQAAGLEDVSAHTLRHTFATNYLEATGDLVGLAQVMGHANINTTAIYARPSLDDLAERLERVGLTE